MQTKLILIDDDRVSTLISSKFLVVAGLKDYVKEIISYNDPTEALEFLFAANACSEEEFYWILLDINMPEISGWDLLDILTKKKLYKNVKVIMLTSSISKEDKSKAATYNFVHGYLSKPLDKFKCEEIIQLINESNKNNMKV